MCLSLYRLLPHISSPLLGILENKQLAWIFIFRPRPLFYGRVIHKLSTGFPQA
nr:MAG TPA: Neuromedin U [Caudoviricetes sp.]